MKPIQKGLAIIAGATLITVLAISFLGEGSKKGTEKEEGGVTDAKEAQSNDSSGNGASNEVNPVAATVEEHKEQATETAQTAAGSSPVEQVSTESSDQKAMTSTVSSTNNTPAPPGPFHKNTLAGTPDMPPAPTAPASANVDLPPPPMPQALLDKPSLPEAPKANMAKPEFVIKKPEIDTTAPEQPDANPVGSEEPAKPVETVDVKTSAPSVKAEVSSEEKGSDAKAAPVTKAENTDMPALSPEQPEANPIVSEEPTKPVAAVDVKTSAPSVEAELSSEEIGSDATATPVAKAENTDIPALSPAPHAEVNAVVQGNMPTKPSAPEVPEEIQQNTVNFQNQSMQQQQQPRVIFVPVPVYPYQQPGMNQQQWGLQAPQMNFMPPQAPIMGDTPPAQGE